jgi:hypothetical protein
LETDRQLRAQRTNAPKAVEQIAFPDANAVEVDAALKAGNGCFESPVAEIIALAEKNITRQKCSIEIITRLSDDVAESFGVNSVVNHQPSGAHYENVF